MGIISPIYVLRSHCGAESNIPDNKAHGTNMGPIWGRQDPGGPHVGPMNFAIWDGAVLYNDDCAMKLCSCSVKLIKTSPFSKVPKFIHISW